MRLMLTKVGLPLVLITGLASCTLHKVDEQVRVPEMVPDTWSETGNLAMPERWWQAWRDPQLDQLMQQMFAQNLQLQAAWQRMLQFEAVAVQAGATRQPNVNLNATAARNKQQFINQFATTNRFAVTLDVSYEIDLWQRLRSGAKAAVLDRETRSQEAQATAMSLSANLARTYYDWQTQYEILALLREQERTNRELLDVLELRFSQASSTAVDVYQQREQLAAVRAAIPLVEARRQVLQHQLAALLGQTPGSLSLQPSQNLPLLPSMPETGIPLDVLRQRPDVEAARLRVASLDHRLAIAVADQYPALRLTGNVGSAAFELSDLFSDWIWGIAASLVQPLWDGKRRAAEVDRVQAALHEALLNYEQQVLQAMMEVENALVQERQIAQNLAQLDQQLEFGQAGYDAALRRYLNGVGAFVNVLRQNQSVLRARQEQINGRNSLLQQRIALYSALGGRWMAETQHIPATQAEGAQP